MVNLLKARGFHFGALAKIKLPRFVVHPSSPFIMLYHAIFELPPSVNGAYNGKVRRFKSDKYKAWLETKVKELKQAYRINQPVAIYYYFTFPDNRTRDISNYTKLLDDRLVKDGIIVDDSFHIIKEAHLYFVEINKNATVEVKIHAIPK